MSFVADLVDEVVLRRADRTVDRPGREALGIDVEVAQDELHEPDGVGLVVDREGVPEPEPVGVAAQDADAGRVERRHPHPLGDGTDEPGHPLAHLLGGLVGERDRQDLERRDTPGADEEGDPVGQHPGLAGAGPGDDEERAGLVEHGVALVRVQTDEQLLGRGRPEAGPVVRLRRRRDVARVIPVGRGERATAAEVEQRRRVGGHGPTTLPVGW